MKRFKISIEEINIDDNYTPIERKRFDVDVIQDDGQYDDILPGVLDHKWKQLKGFFLEKRNDVPFHKIKNIEVDHE